MKTLFLLSVAAIVITATVNAQTPASLKSDIRFDKEAESTIKKEKKQDRKELRKLEGNDVSYQSKQAFATDFAGVTVLKSERLDNFDEFTFTKDGETISAFYDWDSKLVGTTQNKTFADLPAKGQKNISEHFKTYTPGDVLFYDDNELNETDMILFGNQFDDKDSYFVELKKDNKKIVVQVTMDGEVDYFTRLK
ncbi:MAG: hypothetical protein WDO19_24365 [Bacteroidota bacterium]